MNKDCLYCGKTFKKTKTQSKKTWDTVVKYCSRECLGHATGKERFIALNKSRMGQTFSKAHTDKLKTKRIGRKPSLGMIHTQETKERLI